MKKNKNLDVEIQEYNKKFDKFMLKEITPEITRFREPFHATTIATIFPVVFWGGLLYVFIKYIV